MEFLPAAGVSPPVRCSGAVESPGFTIYTGPGAGPPRNVHTTRLNGITQQQSPPRAQAEVRTVQYGRIVGSLEQWVSRGCSSSHLFPRIIEEREMVDLSQLWI